MAKAPYLSTSPRGVLIQVHLQPRARENRIAGVHDGRLKVCVMAPPVDAKANEALREFIAGKLQVAKGRVHLVSGEKSRRKTLLVEGLAAGWVEELLED